MPRTTELLRECRDVLEKELHTHGHSHWDGGWDMLHRIDAHLAQPEAAEPVDIVLYCPKCRMQHIDAPSNNGDTFEQWTNPPHRSHLCRTEDGGCGHIWRPSDRPTNGVARTASGKDSDTAPVAAQPTREQVLHAVIEMVRESPEYDAGGILAEMMDEALAGKTPHLLVVASHLQHGLKPPERVEAQPAQSAEPEEIPGTYDYTRTFNSIAAAVRIEGTALAISCKAFWDFYYAHPPAAQSELRYDYAICHIHGKFYSGYAKCPTCKAMEQDEEKS